jgi:hypothetical protein
MLKRGRTLFLQDHFSNTSKFVVNQRTAEIIGVPRRDRVFVLDTAYARFFEAFLTPIAVAWLCETCVAKPHWWPSGGGGYGMHVNTRCIGSSTSITDSRFY